MKNLSVIIPVHNGEAFISRAIASVFSVSEDIEVVLVENGSTDESWNLISAEYPHLNISRLDYSAKSNARNLGVKQATRDIVTFLDQDDEFRPERFQDEFLEFAFQGGVVIGTQTFIESQKTLMPKYIRHGISRNLPNYCPISMLISKYTFLHLNGFDTTYKLAEDFEFLTRLMRNNIPIKYVEDTFLTRNFHETNDSHNVSEAQRELFKLLRTQARFRKETL